MQILDMWDLTTIEGALTHLLGEITPEKNGTQFVDEIKTLLSKIDQIRADWVSDKKCTSLFDGVLVSLPCTPDSSRYLHYPKEDMVLQLEEMPSVHVSKDFSSNHNDEEDTE